MQLEATFEALFEKLSGMENPEAKNLLGALKEVKDSVKVIEGLEDVSNSTYVIQPLKVWTDGKIGIYTDKDEKAVFGNSVNFYVLKLFTYRVIYDLDQKKIIQRVYDNNFEIPKKDNIAIYQVRSFFCLTEDLKHFFIFEGVRSKIDIAKELEDALKVAVKGKTATYDVIVSMKSVKKKVKSGEFWTVKTEIVGDTKEEVKPILKIAKGFIDDYIMYRKERKIVLAEPEQQETEQNGTEESLSEMY
ncbi:MAG: hypothetical protein QXW35_04435 [Candidatus Aenigmatarchaeota archaeon]